MKAGIAEHLRTALRWLRGRLKPPEQDTDWVEYSKQTAWRSIPRLLPPAQPPSTYEPPEKTTDPTQQIHRLAETGRIASMIRTQKLPVVKGLHKAHFYRMPSTEEVRADKFLLDVEPAAPGQESEDEDPDPTTKVRAILKLKHESREQAS